MRAACSARSRPASPPACRSAAFSPGVGVEGLGLTVTLFLAAGIYAAAILGTSFGRRWAGFLSRAPFSTAAGCPPMTADRHPDRLRRRHDRRVTIVPPVLHEAQLPLAERMAARLDGELFAFGDGHCPIDEVDGPALRLDAVLGSAAARG